MSGPEIDKIVGRYRRRGNDGGRYDPRRPEVGRWLDERRRAVLQLFAERGWHDLPALRVVEVGCGTGGNLIELLRMGFEPEHLTGIELMPDRLAQARQKLPQSLRLLGGDANDATV